MKKILPLIYNFLGFTGLWLAPILYFITRRTFPDAETKHILALCAAVAAWAIFNNFWSVVCEGKPFSEINIGDGLIPETGLKKESPLKRSAMYPKVPAELLSRKPEGIILGKYKNRYVRFPLKDIYHCCVIGGSGSGKSSTVLLDSLLINFAAGRNAFNCFVIDIKGELHQKSLPAFSENVLVVDPADRSSFGWDVYYRLHNNPGDDLIIEAIEEIAQALIISTNPRDSFFVENARSMFTGLLVYYFQQGETFIDSVNKILESEMKSLIAEIVKDSEPSDLCYKYLAKFAGKDAESVEDCMVEMTTSLSHLMKNIAKGTSAIVTIQDEITLLDDYFTIQKYRYGGTISLDYDIEDPALLTNQTLRFTLQPLVENAIFHGIEPKGQNGHISIHIYRNSQKDLRIDITDDGIGMKADEIAAVLSGESASRSQFFKQIGISSVHKQIQYTFGEAYGLSITSEPGVFTKMSILLPYQPKTEKLLETGDPLC